MDRDPQGLTHYLGLRIKESKMNKKLFSLSIFTIALAVAFVFSAPNGAKAADGTKAAGSNYNQGGNYNHRGYIENRSANSFGEEWATNGSRTHRDTDKDRYIQRQIPDFQIYGLQGNWKGAY
jgi:hypothetical protein